VHKSTQLAELRSFLTHNTPQLPDRDQIKARSPSAITRTETSVITLRNHNRPPGQPPASHAHGTITLFYLALAHVGHGQTHSSRRTRYYGFGYVVAGGGTPYAG